MTKRREWLKSVRNKIRPLFYELVVYSLFVNLLALVIPLFVLQVYNRVVAFGNITTLQGLVIGVVLALLFDLVLRQIRSRLLQKAALRIDVGVGQRIMEKLWALPLRTLESRPSSYWLSVFRDIDTIRNTVAGPPYLLLIDLPFAVLFLGLIFIIAEPIAWVFLAIVPAFVGLAAFSGGLVGRASENEKTSQRARDTVVGDMLTNRTTIKSLALNRGIYPVWEKYHAQNIEQSVKRGMVHDGFVNMGMTLTVGTTVLVTTVGALAIIDQKLSIGALIAANMLSARVIGPFSQLVGAWKSFSAYRQSVKRIDELMLLASERTEQTIDLEKPVGRIAIEDLTFGYNENADPVLEIWPPNSRPMPCI